VRHQATAYRCTKKIDIDIKKRTPEEPATHAQHH
jgi:hypothetical protein